MLSIHNMLGVCRHHNAVLAYLISSELGLEIRGLTGHKINDQKEIEADGHIKIEVKLSDNDSVVLDATAADRNNQNGTGTDRNNQNYTNPAEFRYFGIVLHPKEITVTTTQNVQGNNTIDMKRLVSTGQVTNKQTQRILEAKKTFQPENKFRVSSYLHDLLDKKSKTLVQPVKDNETAQDESVYQHYEIEVVNYLSYYDGRSHAQKIQRWLEDNFNKINAITIAI